MCETSRFRKCDTLKILRVGTKKITETDTEDAKLDLPSNTPHKLQIFYTSGHFFSTFLGIFEFFPQEIANEKTISLNN